MQYLGKVADAEQYGLAHPDMDSDEEREFDRLCDDAWESRPVLDLEYGQVQVQADFNSVELRHRVDLYPYPLRRYCRPQVAAGHDAGIDAEDWLRVHTWLEEIGFFEAVRTRKTYSSLIEA